MLRPILLITLLLPALLANAEDAKVRVGLLGIDNYQGVEYVKHFNDPKAEGDLAGLRVVAAYLPKSPDYSESATLTGKWKEQMLGLWQKPADPKDAVPPPEIVDSIKGAGIFIISSATTVAEARMLEARGVDAIIAQGAEAGGHRGTFTGVAMSMQPGLMALLPQVADAVRVPVIAAGGIADGRQVAAAFMLGASAVQMGTAFLRCEEANVKDAHRAALREASDAGTIVTDMLTGRPARYLRNALTDDLIASALPPVAFPAQLSLTGPLEQTGDREMTLLLAGQSAAMGRDTSAGALVEAVAEEAGRRLRLA